MVTLTFFNILDSILSLFLFIFCECKQTFILVPFDGVWQGDYLTHAFHDAGNDKSFSHK